VSETKELLGGTAAKVYGFDVESSSHRQPHRLHPEDLGQDPSLAADPDAAAKAKWCCRIRDHPDALKRPDGRGQQRVDRGLDDLGR